MKKLIFLFAMLMTVFVASAQKVTLPGLSDGQTYYYTPTDYTLTGTTGLYFTINTATPKPATQDFTIKLDSVSGNHTNVAVSLYGVKSLIKNDSTQIGSTVNWVGIRGGGLSKDTVITISNATANRFKYYKWKVVGTGSTGVSKVSDTELKLREE